MINNAGSPIPFPQAQAGRPLAGQIIKVQLPNDGFDDSLQGGERYFVVDSAANGRVFGRETFDVQRNCSGKYSDAPAAFEIIA